MSAGPPVPRYGSAALADLPASVLGAFGVPGGRNVLALPQAPRVCVLIIDGLGWELLREHAQDAPYLSSLPGRALTAGFPATTATSLASLGTGLPPGGHGLFGIQVAVPGTGRLLNCLHWDDSVDPQTFQPARTAYERAAEAGISVGYVASGAYRGSGLSRATARGAAYLAADSLGQLVARAEQALREGERSYVTVYHADLDSTGHLYGAGSPAWRYQLRFVDQLAERIAEILPPGGVLYVTADHGMVNPTERIDVDEVPALQEGVAQLGGEPRARHVYAEPGAAGDVLAAWRELVGDRAWVCTREEAVAAGWFGPVAPELLPRIGDVLAVPHGDLAIVATKREPIPSMLVGMHGSMIPREQLVPLITADHRL
ncbi:MULTISPECIES: alkaline phosphatase family protein [Thermomonospora]|uniref:Type I phosphodiesterase/nucleotide pyrophosphatase n=1 Tax=Thermomonospora curvata (strain ATCC 19995 / DSM 43183 / JCM 3096 / KCTC 9072 / NBRC 15933 / NCIMB 10081 / Henssen B9) TaxID=471852 RepID=D1ABH0_THECD|nr:MULTISPECIES: nucleotide pyrophosphatase/phosphodiesterase family protein [Thermomonospora]ACY97206.1 type I phosphodiesterase/nucleotide pyrophosphatase [Thermomonospora curvata DSM 43183]